MKARKHYHLCTNVQSYFETEAKMLCVESRECNLFVLSLLAKLRTVFENLGCYSRTLVARTIRYRSCTTYVVAMIRPIHESRRKNKRIVRTIRPARPSKRHRLYINSQLYTVLLLIAWTLVARTIRYRSCTTNVVAMIRPIHGSSRKNKRIVRTIRPARLSKRDWPSIYQFAVVYSVFTFAWYQ